jgi:hypothetical protein
MSVNESAPKAGGNALSRRLNKILETRLENDKETLEALKELSTFFTENTLQARRNLRSKIEKRSLAINEVVSCTIIIYCIEFSLVTFIRYGYFVAFSETGC